MGISFCDVTHEPAHCVCYLLMTLVCGAVPGRRGRDGQLFCGVWWGGARVRAVALDRHGPSGPRDDGGFGGEKRVALECING